MTVAKVTSKGQITIPVSVRRKLGLSSGSFVSFSPHGEVYVLNPLHTDPLDELEGFFGSSETKHTIDEMNEAIRKQSAKAFASGGD